MLLLAALLLYNHANTSHTQTASVANYAHLVHWRFTAITAVSVP
jgi:hypothetical protein